MGFVVEGVVVVEGVDVVDGVVAELPPIAAYATPLPTASIANAASTRMMFFTAMIASLLVSPSPTSNHQPLRARSEAAGKTM